MASDGLLVVHGGGPTAVINASLYGAVDEALSAPGVGRVLGALGGVGGITEGRFVDFRQVPREKLDLLPFSPSSAIGTSRKPLEDEDYRELAHALGEQGVRWLLCTGGNGTMDTCGKIWRACHEEGVPIDVVGIPKTMDNDIAVTDHAPGFASAARYMAATTSAICCDVRGLPIHIVVVEAMGRNAGWVTAASCFADESGTGGPDLIYLPERAFDERAFLDDAQRLIDEKGSGVVVVSEGVHTADGTPVAPPLMTVGRATYFGDVSAHLAKLVISELGYKARSEKPGLIGRASIAWQSPVDREEAVACGREATRAVLEGDSGKMVGIERVSTTPYESRLIRIPIEKVMLDERTVPDEFINERGNGVTDAFRSWCRPLLGPALPRFASFV
ncbi:MAG TPA: diphosphate--fructose-6-phosphate 1-phosphotransferase [Candidatus Olsenella avicola]|nr:diphosphate--fructose-6-phosphate 1-phosphotransferase [Candidatus Olsenella avicola]